MTKFPLFLTLFAAAVVAMPAIPGAQPQLVSTTKDQERYRAAADYSRQTRGLSVLVMKGGQVVFEEYQNGHTAQTPHVLYSGTKSFNGVMAAAAAQDGMLRFDDRVSDTITEWKTDARRTITIRQLLSLTSGLEPGQNGRVPSYSVAVGAGPKYEPGTMFEYNPTPFQVWGELMRRKLAARGGKAETPLDYLKRRVLNPIGLNVADWTLQDGQPNLPQGASLTTREWAKFGQLVIQGGAWNGQQIVPKKRLDECFMGSQANPNYGLTWWLNRSHDGSATVAPPKSGGLGSRLRQRMGRPQTESETTLISKNGFGAQFPQDLRVAAGAGKQRLYIIPSLDLVIVRQGQQSPFDDAEFLKRLLL